MYLLLDEKQNYNQNNTIQQLSLEPEKSGSHDGKNVDINEVDQLPDNHKDKETDILVDTAREFLPSKNENATSTYEFSNKITKFYGPSQFWEKPIEIEKYLYPHFVAYNEEEEYRRECEKEKQKNKTYQLSTNAILTPTS